MLRLALASLLCAAVSTGAADPKPDAKLETKAAPQQLRVSQCNVDGPYIAFTFDDGPHGVQTPRLLKILKERSIKATFFCLGQCVAQNPEVAKQIVADGHEIASHSWSHPQLTKLGEGGVREELQKTHDVIKQTTGVVPLVMRPPYGAFTQNQTAWAHSVWGYKNIMWDVDSDDWKAPNRKNPSLTKDIILRNTRAGSIILTHDIHKTTVDAMPATLDALVAKGFKFVTVSELLKMHRSGAVPAKVKLATPATAEQAADAPIALPDVKPVPEGPK